MSVKILLMTFVLVVSGLTQTTQWRLIWDKNLESDSVKYYEIYRGTTSEPGTVLITVPHEPRSGIDTTMVFTDSTLNVPGKGLRIYYRLKAVNDAGPSGFSETVNAAIPKLILSYNLYLPIDTTYKISLSEWVQDPTTPIGSMIWEFGFPTGFSTSIVTDNGNPILQITTPADWQAGTIASIRVENEDEFYDSTSVAVYADSTPPPPEITITNIDPVGSDFAHIFWQSTLATKAYIEYGTSELYDDSSSVDETFKTTSDRRISGLKDSTLYHVRVVGVSEQGIIGRSNDTTFTTLAIPIPPPLNVYPIPLELSNPLHNKRITFEGIPSGGSLYIFNLLGDPVYKETNIQTDLFYWPAVNNADRRVHTGVYLYLIKSSNGKKFDEGKVVVIY